MDPASLFAADVKSAANGGAWRGADGELAPAHPALHVGVARSVSVEQYHRRWGAIHLDALRDSLEGLRAQASTDAVAVRLAV